MFKNLAYFTVETTNTAVSHVSESFAVGNIAQALAFDPGTSPHKSDATKIGSAK